MAVTAERASACSLDMGKQVMLRIFSHPVGLEHGRAQPVEIPDALAGTRHPVPALIRIHLRRAG